MNLRPLERRILAILVEKEKFTKREIMNRLYPVERSLQPDRGVLRVSICNLRKKLGIEIKTLHGIGYSLDQESRPKALECLTPTP